jgi:hypothetical protein
LNRIERGRFGALKSDSTHHVPYMEEEEEEVTVCR